MTCTFVFHFGRMVLSGEQQKLGSGGCEKGPWAQLRAQSKVMYSETICGHSKVDFRLQQDCSCSAPVYPRAAPNSILLLQMLCQGSLLDSAARHLLQGSTIPR